MTRNLRTLAIAALCGLAYLFTSARDAMRRGASQRERIKRLERINADLLAALVEITSDGFSAKWRSSMIYCHECDSTYHPEAGFDDSGVLACPFCADEAHQEKMNDVVDRARAAIAKAVGE